MIPTDIEEAAERWPRDPEDPLATAIAQMRWIFASTAQRLGLCGHCMGIIEAHYEKHLP